MLRKANIPFTGNVSTVLIAGALIVALIVGYLLSWLDTGYQLVLAALIIGGFLAFITFSALRFGFYVLLISSMFGRLEISTQFAALRPDQVVLMPVLAGVALRLAVVSLSNSSQFSRRLQLSVIPAIVFAGLILYLAVNGLSSFLFSPIPFESFKIVAWLLLSFLAFVITYFVVGRYVGVREAFFAVLIAGFASGAVGVALFILAQLTGSTFGLQQDIAPKVYGTFFEANIFGSFQAFTVISGIAMLHLRQVRRRAFVWVAVGTVISTMALALSFTRAAWLALLAGLLVLIFFQLKGGRFILLLARLGIFTFIALLAVSSMGLLNSLSTRFASIPDFSRGTVAFRFVRFNIALAEWPSSPILGLGTNSFGQRHLDPTQNYAPDYLPSLFLATLYDTGLVGLLILIAVLGVLFAALVYVIGSSAVKWQTSLALVLLCGLTTLLVAYQASNGFWFSYNWIIVGIVLRLYQLSRSVRTPISPPVL